MGYLKTTIISSIMFVIGGFFGYKLCEKKLAETYRKDIEDTIQRMKRYDEEVEAENNDDEDDDDHKASESVVLLKKQLAKTPDKEQPSKVNYSKFAKPNIFDYAHEVSDMKIKDNKVELTADVAEDLEEEDDGDDDDNDDDTEPDPQEDEENEYEPYMILEEQYYDCMNNQGDDGQMLFYYTKDQVVCEEDDSVVDDYYKILGYDFENILDTDAKVWVRNANLRTVYEICRIDKSYAESVTNLAETPKEKEFRHAGRLKEAKDA